MAFGAGMMNRAIFLDRDGVINAMVYNPEFGLVDSPANPDEFHLLPDAAAAIRVLKELGFLTVVISNQPGVAKGKFSRTLLQAMTEKMLACLGQRGAFIDRVYYCLHHPEGIVEEYRKVCDCRKPKPGLLLQAAEELGINLSQSFFIGDGITDVLAGQAAGTRTILIYPSSRSYIYPELEKHNAKPDYIVNNIWDAAQMIQALEASKSLERG